MIKSHILTMPTPFRKLIIISVAVLMSLGIQNASAQTKYNSWNDPNAPAPRPVASPKSNGDVLKLVDDLRKMVRDARRARAADPKFLDDLRTLIRRYDMPWRVNLVSETFYDGNFTYNPTWKATSGRWWIEKNFGLRAAFEQTTTRSNNTNNNQQGDGDIGKQLLGAILNQALGGKQQSSGSNSQTPSQNKPIAAIHLDRKITNAFSTEIEFSSWRNEGSFEIAIYQGSERQAGYRLFYRSGQATALELVRSSRYGTNAIQSYRQKVNLEDKKKHVLLWNRNRRGNMTISIDGKELMRVADRSFNDPFNGLSLINHNGDYIISKVNIKGTN